ncbi:helix-turn-helix domain-containing protein, partial [Streptomyces sp. NPDC006602]|uniref:helix-turn-helix domain-containing protein n=1 Tax=Streptomyces sp. NPDC006602 TaxID=3364751 RepID=UPI00369AC84B
DHCIARDTWHDQAAGADGRAPQRTADSGGAIELCLRIDAGRPIAHVAAEAGISRRCLAKWYARWRAHGEDGLLDHSSRPVTSPARTAQDVADLVEALRRQTKHGPARLAADLKRLHSITVAPATVHRILVRRGLNRLRDLDPPTGEQLRKVIRYEQHQPHRYPSDPLRRVRTRYC